MPKTTKTVAAATADLELKVKTLQLRRNDIDLQLQRLENKLEILRHKNGAATVSDDEAEAAQ